MSLSASQQAFVASVLALEPRVAVFDCDGTLWNADSGAGFFYWELERGLIPDDVARAIRARYDDYLAGRVGEEDMCGEMVQIHRGVSEQRIRDMAKEYFEAEVVRVIFPEMLELARALRERGCDLWAVSSTNNWVVEAGVQRFGIPKERVLAACVRIEKGLATGALVHVPSGEGKAVALRAAMRTPIDAVFGNSIHDAAMLELARHPFCINPNQDLLAMAQQRGWRVYWPAGAIAAR